MTEASDSQCCDRRKRNINWVTWSINITRKLHNNRFIYSIPLRKIPLSQQQTLLVLPHSIFHHFSFHEKSFLGYSKKYLQFQEESDEESTPANLQLLPATCLSHLQIAQSKLAIKIPTLRQTFAQLRRKEHPV